MNYFETLLNADEPVEFHDFSGHVSMDEIGIDMEPPTTEKVDKAIDHLIRHPEMTTQHQDCKRWWQALPAKLSRGCCESAKLFGSRKNIRSI